MQVINHQVSKQTDYIIYSIVGSLLTFTILCSIGLSLNNVSAVTGTASDSTMDTTSVAVAASCSMTATIDTAHNGNVPNGVYSGGNDYYPNGIGETTIATRCNDPSGYSIYAIGVAESGSNSNTALYSSILGNNYNIGTGVYQAGTTTDSTWSMKVSKVTDSSSSYLPANLTIENSFDNYHSVPANYTEVARFSSATDVTLGSKIKTTYDAYIDGDQPAGTYKGHVKYTLVHPGGTDVPDVDTMQRVEYWGGSLAVGEEVTVNDTRDGNSYTVSRLCTNYDSNNSCTSSQLWMTQNLDLQIGGTYNGNPIELTSENTNLTTAYAQDGTTLLSGYSIDPTGVIKWTPAGNATVTGTPATISDFSYVNKSSPATNVVSGWTNNHYAPYQAEGQLNGSDVYMYNSGTTAHDTIYGTLSDCTNAGHTAAECAHYKIGNYYNFTAANAMNDSSTYTAQYTVMPNSICPKGWRLPKGITEGGTVISEFNKMLKAQGVTNGEDLVDGTDTGYTANGLNMIRTTGAHGDPLYFVRSGHVDGTTLYDAQRGGDDWSSTLADPSHRGYYLAFSPLGVWPANHTGRGSGRPVRCVADF